jgi:hypothetical protein
MNLFVLFNGSVFIIIRLLFIEIDFPVCHQYSINHRNDIIVFCIVDIIDFDDCIDGEYIKINKEE